jgi:2-polyprenyl-3-methyl-5-hydroxy-6-metoxy-1,4-benzoquinol methylase
MRTPAPPPPDHSIHHVPKVALADRIDFLVRRVRGLDVVDIGFVDAGRMEGRLEEGVWLHAQLDLAARSIVGLDSDKRGVDRARELGYRAFAADCESRKSLEALELEPADIVVAGELVEHLTSPGRFLEAVKVLLRPGGSLILTTPNATALTNALAGVMGKELVNREHVLWLSWRTAASLLERHGWTLTEFAYCPLPWFRPPARPLSTRARASAMNTYQRLARPLFRLRPALADGLIIVAKPS